MSNFPKAWKILSAWDLLNNIVSGFVTVKRVALNILWLTKSGPIALFTGSIEIMSNTFCSSIKILQSVSLG